MYNKIDDQVKSTLIIPFTGTLMAHTRTNNVFLNRMASTKYWLFPTTWLGHDYLQWNATNEHIVWLFNIHYIKWVIESVEKMLTIINAIIQYNMCTIQWTLIFQLRQSSWKQNVRVCVCVLNIIQFPVSND